MLQMLQISSGRVYLVWYQILLILLWVVDIQFKYCGTYIVIIANLALALRMLATCLLCRTMYNESLQVWLQVRHLLQENRTTMSESMAGGENRR